MDALFGRAAGLRRVELVEPKHVIGKSSAESIQSGMIYGFSAQVDGLVDRFVAELGPCEVIATGGLGRADHPALAYGAALRTVAHVVRPADHLRTESLMEDEFAARLAKVEEIRARGDDPYPVRFDRTHTLQRGARAVGRQARSRARRPTTSCASPAGCCSSARRAGSRSPTSATAPASSSSS